MPLLLLLAGATACPADDADDTTPAETDTEDTDPCAGAPDRQSFIDEQVPRLCTYDQSCPDREDFDDDECVRSSSAFYANVSCFDECLALQCANWLDTEPACTDPSGRPDASCLDLFDCQD